MTELAKVEQTANTVATEVKTDETKVKSFVTDVEDDFSKDEKAVVSLALWEKIAIGLIAVAVIGTLAHLVF